MNKAFPSFQPSKREYQLALRGLHIAGVIYPYDKEDMLSKSADAHWRHRLAIDKDFQWFPFYDVAGTGTEVGYGFVHDQETDEDVLMVGFAGTSPLSWKDWKTNADRELVPYANGGGEEVAEGDLRNWYRVRNHVVAELQRLILSTPITTIHIGAHSLGQAAAILAVREILENPKTKDYCFNIRVDTFGGKRFANAAFWSSLWSLVDVSACDLIQFRFWVHPADPVPFVPLRCHPNLPAIRLREKRWGVDWLWRKTPFLHLLPHSLKSYEEHLLRLTKAL